MYFGKSYVAAVVTSLVSAASSSIMRRAVSSTDLDNMDFYAQYSAAAYCTNNHNSTGDNLTCPAGNCPRVESADTVTTDEFLLSSSYGDVTGFVAADRTNKLIVLSFRGSSNLDNWLADINFPLTDASSLCAGCQVHSGFWQAWGTVESRIKSDIDSAMQTYPGYALVFTGHSYGAALAALAATSLRNDGKTVQLYNYGQPRIGNPTLSQYITSQNKGPNYRVTHTDDPVPKSPPTVNGYSHFSPEYWITSGNGVPVTTADIEVVNGIDSTAGNAGTVTSSIDSHRWYFFAISACS